MSDALRASLPDRGTSDAQSRATDDWLACQALASRLGLPPDQTEAVARVLLGALLDVRSFDEIELDDVEPAVQFVPRMPEGSHARRSDAAVGQ